MTRKTMELVLTKEQKKHLDEKGPFKASDLQRAFKESVQDQQKLLDQAAKIRSKRKLKTA